MLSYTIDVIHPWLCLPEYQFIIEKSFVEDFFLFASSNKFLFSFVEGQYDNEVTYFGNECSTLYILLKLNGLTA